MQLYLLNWRTCLCVYWKTYSCVYWRKCSCVYWRTCSCVYWPEGHELCLLNWRTCSCVYWTEGHAVVFTELKDMSCFYWTEGHAVVFTEMKDMPLCLLNWRTTKQYLIWVKHKDILFYFILMTTCFSHWRSSGHLYKTQIKIALMHARCSALCKNDLMMVQWQQHGLVKVK